MQGLLSFLIFAALFYVMMRFGCGAHMVHGHGGSEEAPANHGHHAGAAGRASAASRTRAVDPVCGTEVPADQGYGKMYNGREYRLCSRPCLDKFEAHPEQYALQGGA